MVANSLVCYVILRMSLDELIDESPIRCDLLCIFAMHIPSSKCSHIVICESCRIYLKSTYVATNMRHSRAHWQTDVVLFKYSVSFPAHYLLVFSSPTSPKHFLSLSNSSAVEIGHWYYIQMGQIMATININKGVMWPNAHRNWIISNSSHHYWSCNLRMATCILSWCFTFDECITVKFGYRKLRCNENLVLRRN